MDKAKIRNMLIALLDDEEGIGAIGYHHLQAMFYDDHQDIFDSLREQNGRIYLPEDFQKLI